MKIQKLTLNKKNETADCPVCHGTGQIGTTDWLTRGMTKEEIAREKEEALADIVEVVRCKDCVECDHCYPRKDKGGEAIEGYYCYYHKRWVNASYYCGDGERKNDK